MRTPETGKLLLQDARQQHPSERGQVGIAISRDFASGLAVGNHLNHAEEFYAALPVLRNISLTEVFRVSLAREAARDRVLPKNDNLAKLELFRKISMEAAALPIISYASEDEILGYDENGIPTQ